MNRRPTVYETVALPLSYTGFGHPFQAPRNGRTAQKTSSRHPFFSSPKVLRASRPFRTRTNGLLPAQSFLREIARPSPQRPECADVVRVHKTLRQAVSWSSRRGIPETLEMAPANPRAFGHRFGATRQDSAEVIPRTSKVGIGDTRAPGLRIRAETNGPTQFRYLPGARSSRRTASGLRDPSYRPS